MAKTSSETGEAKTEKVKDDRVPYHQRDKVMPLINALPLTADQKTALALCWWSEATVRKYKLW